MCGGEEGEEWEKGGGKCKKGPLSFLDVLPPCLPDPPDCDPRISMLNLEGRV